MTIEKIRDLCNAEPFKPFTVHFPDGRSVPVKHPDFVAFFPSGKLLIVTLENDAESVIDPSLVSDITVSQKIHRNGKTR
ncbi:MAG: hypothetical protein ACREFE_04845 [Limisphaerales bacterium]